MYEEARRSVQPLQPVADLALSHISNTASVDRWDQLHQLNLYGTWSGTEIILSLWHHA